MASAVGDTAELYKSWFALADVDRDGKLTGGEAVAFLSRAELPQPVLKRVRAAWRARRASGYAPPRLASGSGGRALSGRFAAASRGLSVRRLARARAAA